MFTQRPPPSLRASSNWRPQKLLINYTTGHNLFLNPGIIEFNLSNLSFLPVSLHNTTQKAPYNLMYKRTFFRIKEISKQVHVVYLVFKLCFPLSLVMTTVTSETTSHIVSVVKIL